MCLVGVVVDYGDYSLPDTASLFCVRAEDKIYAIDGGVLNAVDLVAKTLTQVGSETAVANLGDVVVYQHTAADIHMSVDRFKQLVGFDVVPGPTEGKPLGGGTPVAGTFVEFGTNFKLGVRARKSTKLESVERPFLVATTDASLYPISVIRIYRSNVIAEKLDAIEIRKELLYLQSTQQFSLMPTVIAATEVQASDASPDEAYLSTLTIPPQLIWVTDSDTSYTYTDTDTVVLIQVEITSHSARATSTTITAAQFYAKSTDTVHNSLIVDLQSMIMAYLGDSSYAVDLATARELTGVNSVGVRLSAGANSSLLRLAAKEEEVDDLGNRKVSVWTQISHHAQEYAFRIRVLQSQIQSE